MRIEIVVFFIILAMMLLLRIAIGYSAKKRDEKVLDELGEKDKKESDKNNQKLKKVGEGEIFTSKNLWLLVLIVVGYSFLLMAMSVVFPDLWKLLWENQPLFWLIMVGMFVGIGLLLLPGKLSSFGVPIGFALIMVLLIGIGKSIVDTLPKEEQVASAKQKVSTSIPSRKFGIWNILVGTDPIRKFCPPSGSYTTIERENSFVGIHFTIVRPSGRTVSKYHPPGDTHLEIGAFKCLTATAQRETEITIVISKTPLS